MKTTIKLGNLLVIVLSIFVILLVGWISIAPTRIVLKTQNKRNQVSPREIVSFQFSQPVIPAEVEEAFTIFPPVDGIWIWMSNQSAQWQAYPAFIAVETYAISFTGNKQNHVGKNNYWQLRVRSAQILALGNTSDGQELFLYETDSDTSPVQLTQTSGKVVDYSPSTDGEFITISILNESHGADLWLINREKDSLQLFLNCGADQCVETEWKPDTKEFLFTRYLSSTDYRMANLWNANMDTATIEMLFADSSHYGSRPNLSPDGNRLAYWSGVNINIYDYMNGITYPLDGTDSQSACWSIDGEQFYYTKTMQSTASNQNIIINADISKNTLSTILGDIYYGEWISYSSPACNPAGSILAVTAQENVHIPGRLLLMIDLTAMDEVTVEDNFAMLPAYLSWFEDGQTLLYQYSNTGEPAHQPYIWIWDRKESSKRKICDQCFYPQWLP